MCRVQLPKREKLSAPSDVASKKLPAPSVCIDYSIESMFPRTDQTYG